MTVSRDVEAEIARLYHAEHWKVGTIAAQLGVHEDVVRRVVGRLPKKDRDEAASPAPAGIVPYVEFIRETLERYPTLCSTRLWDMLRDRGFGGSARALRRYVKKVRPKGEREAFLRLDPLIGEEAQIDWAHVGQVPVEGGGHRALWLFVMVLSWFAPCGGNFASTSRCTRSCGRWYAPRATLVAVVAGNSANAVKSPSRTDDADRRRGTD